MFQPKYDGAIKLSSFFKFPSHTDINKKNTYFFNSASQGLMFFLQNIGSGLNVGISVYTCSSVFNAILDGGHKISFLDIGFDTCYDDLDHSNIDVLIITHYFGKQSFFSSQIKERYPSLVIIEDCSHCYFGQNIKKPYSDMALFSFNFHKPIVVGVGGCIEVSSKYVNLEEKHNSLSVLGFLSEFKLFFIIGIKNFAYNPYVFFWIRILIEKRRKGDYERHYSKITPQKFTKFGLRMLKNQISKLNRKLNLNYLKLPNRFRLATDEYSVLDLSYFPIFFKSSLDRDRFKMLLIKEGIETDVLWENCFQHAEYYGLEDGDYPLTDEILKNILFLPSHIIKKNKYFNIVINNLK